jgi:hypothetical protein
VFAGFDRHPFILSSLPRLVKAIVILPAIRSCDLPPIQIDHRLYRIGGGPESVGQCFVFTNLDEASSLSDLNSAQSFASAAGGGAGGCSADAGGTWWVFSVA